jgi:uncharacterized membrane protein YkoI
VPLFGTRLTQRSRIENPRSSRGLIVCLGRSLNDKRRQQLGGYHAVDKCFTEDFVHILRAVGVLALTSLFIVGIGSAQERKIKRSDLPPAVERTVAQVSKGATIKGFSQETENGRATYEVAMLVGGHSKDVEIDPHGAVREVEEEVTTDSLSADVQAGLNAKAVGGKILKVESITKNNKLVAYEAKVERAGKKSEIQVGPDGKPLHHEE